MCLSRVYRGKEKQKALDKLPESGYYWKVVTKTHKVYYPLYFTFPGGFKPGWNKTDTINPWHYLTAFHIFRNKIDAQNYYNGQANLRDGRGSRISIIRCIVKKRDIVATGEQKLYLPSGVVSRALTIVTTRFWCPKFKK